MIVAPQELLRVHGNSRAAGNSRAGIRANEADEPLTFTAARTLGETVAAVSSAARCTSSSTTAALSRLRLPSWPARPTYPGSVCCVPSQPVRGRLLRLRSGVPAFRDAVASPPSHRGSRAVGLGHDDEGHRRTRRIIQPDRHVDQAATSDNPRGVRETVAARFVCGSSGRDAGDGGERTP